jgi:hypothetical protein
MLFTPDSIVKARRALYEQMEAGTLTRQQAFQQALELDPFDVVALVILADERYKAGDLAGTVEYCWRAVAADPCHFEPWFKLCACLTGESQDLLDGIMELGARKALRDPEGLGRFEEAFKNKKIAADFVDGEEFLEATADLYHEKRRDEPAEVSGRLRPYRLIDDLLETADDGLDIGLVDEILGDGARCLPLLIGVLRAMATGSLPEGNTASIVSSLALLGEIGDPAVLPELVECFTVNDLDIQGSADWAVKRIASRRPEASLEVIRKLAPAADAEGRCNLAMAVAHFPEQPEKHDVLLSMLDGLAAFPKSERHDLFMAVALALEFSEGKKGRELAWSLLSRHAAVLPKRTRGELRDAFKVHDVLDSELAGDVPEATVYDLCCHPWDEDDDDDEEDDDDDDDEEDDDEEDDDEGDDDDNPFDDEEEDEEDDEFDDFVPEPVRRTVILGRNDLCWCGSGKKYKKCHLESDEKGPPAPLPTEKSAEDAPTLESNAQEAALRKRLIEFATGILRKREMEEALFTFVGSDPPAGGDQDMLSSETLDWMIHDYVPPRLGRPIIEEFLKRSPGGLTVRERKILEAWSRARFSLFEVQDVREGSGVRLKDLLAGDEFFVYDVSTSKRAALWDCYLARVEEFEGRRMFTAMVLTIPQPSVAPLKEWAIEAQQRSGLTWDAFLRTNSYKLRQEASRVLNRATESRRVVSFEGDELVFSKARYSVVNEEAVRRALDQSKAFLRDEAPDDYGWLDETEDATGGRRAYGHIHIGDGKLTLECTTRQRLKRGNELLRSLAGEHLRHLGDDFTSWQSAMRDRRSSPSPPKPASLPPEVERELVQKVLAEHYRQWPDVPLPALSGKTPREAAATPQGRAQVVDLLKMLENGEEHRRRDGRAWFDVSKLKAELGVEF